MIEINTEIDWVCRGAKHLQMHNQSVALMITKPFVLWFLACLVFFLIYSMNFHWNWNCIQCSIGIYLLNESAKLDCDHASQSVQIVRVFECSNWWSNIFKYIQKNESACLLRLFTYTSSDNFCYFFPYCFVVVYIFLFYSIVPVVRFYCVIHSMWHVWFQLKVEIKRGQLKRINVEMLKCIRIYHL